MIRTLVLRNRNYREILSPEVEKCLPQLAGPYHIFWKEKDTIIAGPYKSVRIAGQIRDALNLISDLEELDKK